MQINKKLIFTYNGYLTCKTKLIIKISWNFHIRFINCRPHYLLTKISYYET